MKHFFYTSRLLACLVFFIFATTALANDFQQEIRRQFFEALNSDSLFRNIEQVKKEAESMITKLCSGYPEDNLYGGARAFASQQACSGSVSTAFPGSAYNPRAGGYLVFGNVIVYLTAIPAQTTKIVSQENFLITAVPNPYFPGSYTVSVKVPEGGSAQFMLTKDGIIDIQSISSVYDIENAFLKQNKKISRKTLVTEILEYFKLLKQKQKISSLDFIISMLTSIEAQENFVEYVLQKQGGKK